MGQICPSVNDTKSQPVSWPKISLNIFGQLIGWLLVSLMEGQICTILIASSVYLSLWKLPYTQCSRVETSGVFLAFMPFFYLNVTLKEFSNVSLKLTALMVNHLCGMPRCNMSHFFHVKFFNLYFQVKKMYFYYPFIPTLWIKWIHPLLSL